LLSLLPAVLKKEKTPANAFIIGYGTGTTAATLAEALPAINLKIAEIEPAVVSAGRCFKHNNRLIDPETVTTGDARQILQKKESSFDLIISQPSEPWVQGSTNLFSVEFYKLVKSRLASGGKFSQWLQLYGLDNSSLVSAVKTFQSVFPHSIIFHQRGAGEIIIIGSNDRLDPGAAAAEDSNAMQNNFYRLPLRQLLARAGIDNLKMLKDCMLLDSKDLAQCLRDWQTVSGARLVSDDNMALEMDSVPEIENAESTIDGNLALLSQKRTKAITPSKLFPKTSPEKTIVQENLIEGQYQRKAVSLLREGNENAASELVNSALSKDPCSTSALNLAALIKLSHGEQSQAALLIEKSIKLNPDKAYTHLLRSFLALTESDTPAALQEADVAHRLCITDYRPYVLAGAALHLGGEDIQALAKLNKARQICSDGVILKEVDGLAEEFSQRGRALESTTLSGTIATRLTRLLRGFSLSSSTRCNDVF